MNSNKRNVRIVGILYIVQMATAILSHSVILSPILYNANFLNELAAKPDLVTMAMLSDLTCGASVFAIAVLLFPILKEFSERVALWYVGQRLTELVGFMISGLLLMTLLTMGQELPNVAPQESAYIESLGRYLREARGNIQNIALLVYCLGAWSLYGLLYYSKLVPRFISIWGLVGVTLLFVEITSNIYNTSLGGIMIMMPLGLNEIFLGIWLIVRGFNQTPGSFQSLA